MGADSVDVDILLSEIERRKEEYRKDMDMYDTQTQGKIIALDSYGDWIKSLFRPSVAPVKKGNVYKTGRNRVGTLAEWAELISKK